MKNLIVLVIALTFLSACNKVKLKRLEGTWKVKEIKETPNNTYDTWSNLLTTTDVKVVFYQDGSFRIFYFENDILTEVSNGTYLLSEDDATLAIDGSSIIFNAHGFPLDVTSLQRNSMTLEGRYYVHYFDSTAAVDSYVTLRWSFDK